METWEEKNKIKHHITSPYHHQSNGRVERLNRTVQEGINKQDKALSLRKRLKKALDVYNICIYSAIGITPSEARDVDNLENLKRKHFYKRIEKYKKLFKYKEQESLKVNDMVLVQDHVHKYKGQPKFSKIGEISELLQNDCYIIKFWKKKGINGIISPWGEIIPLLFFKAIMACQKILGF